MFGGIINTGVTLRVLASVMALAIAALSSAPSVHGQELARGRLLFESQCSRCHGMTGGGAMGPSLRRAVLRRAPDDSAFAQLLASGIPERGMPGIWQLNAAEIGAVIGYVRSLGRVADVQLTGDSARGQAVFAGKGGCRGCHIVDGVGGVAGPELTQIGLMRGASHLREALVKPGAALPVGTQTNYAYGQFTKYLPVRAVTTAGNAVSGLRVNEDPFTIQVRTLDGRLQSWRKAGLSRFEKRFGESLMPSYAGVLSAGDLDDLVAYLASLREASTGPRSTNPIP